MARLTRWGNSNGGLRIPKVILEGAGLRVGDEISCRLLDSGAILLTPTRGSAGHDGNIIAAKPCSKPLEW